MATDPDILLGYVNTDEAINNYADFPTTAVFAPLDINPQIIMFDPETYPISSWDEVKGTGAVIAHFGGATYTEYLVSAGIVDAGQLDGSYDGAPTRFIAEGGALMQQGFATQEPYNYENVFFYRVGKPVDFLLIHDAGSRSIRPADDPRLEARREPFLPLGPRAGAAAVGGRLPERSGSNQCRDPASGHRHRQLPAADP
ncbi:MAG: hypothetical protein R2710_22960 [Acidimicrobiales bacterium]